MFRWSGTAPRGQTLASGEVDQSEDADSLTVRERIDHEVHRPPLYLHGLSTGDFELALRGLLGDAARLSASSIQRLKTGWQAQYDAWRRRDLSDRSLVYLWADDIYVKAGLEQSKAALHVLTGALADGRKVLLAVESGQRESTASWAAILRELTVRGPGAPKLTVADGLEATLPETLGLYAHPEPEARHRLRTTNALECEHEETRRRTRVIRIFPNEASYLHFATAVAIDRNDAWAKRRYVTSAPPPTTEVQPVKVAKRARRRAA